MDFNDLFTPGDRAGLIPAGDEAREAVSSLRGYAYQILAAALAWVDVAENERLYLEVAEDYATVVGQVLDAVQVKDTAGSGSVTLNSKGVREALAAFVDLVSRNPQFAVSLRYFTTSKIGMERERPEEFRGLAGLEYWRRAAAGADMAPLRKILQRDPFPPVVQEFAKLRDDAALRTDLLERVHWYCGQPEFSVLRDELERRLVIVGRDKFGVPAEEARRLADILAFGVLRKSIAKTRDGRVLTRADLYTAIEGATRVSVPRGTIEALGQLSSALAGSLGDSGRATGLLAAEGRGWLIKGDSLPTPRAAIPRVSIETAVSNALTRCSACVLVGSSGLGKSTIARSVSANRGGEFAMVDLRNIEAVDARQRLDAVFANIGGLQVFVLMLEDLGDLDSPGVALAAGRVIAALRRRDRSAIITCYRKPSLKALSEAGLDPACIVEVPYFSEKEVRELVQLTGGDAHKWGRLAYMAGALGHPQLTHAFVVGMAARGWPDKEIDDVILRGLSSDDIDAARDAARRNLITALPADTRTLLYRLSLLGGRLNRSMAITIGALPRPISQPAECLDQLVGPWVERLGGDSYRVSPLAGGFGREMLSAEEQQLIHEAITGEILSSGTIDVADADTVLMHAIAARSAYGVVMLANSVLMADPRTAEILAENLILIPHLRFDTSPFSGNSMVASFLRLAQFKLLAVKKDGANARQAAALVFDEVNRLPDGKAKQLLNAFVCAVVVSTMGVADFLDDWVSLLLRFKVMVDADKGLDDLMAGIEASPEVGGASALASLFAIGSAGISSVERLEHVIDNLEKLQPRQRNPLLVPIDKGFSDYSVFVNSPWVLEKDKGTLDAQSAAERYQRMATTTEAWGNRALTLQCWVARAAMLDEYGLDEVGALAALDDAAARLGDDPILSRARAKVHWRHDRHREALEILRGIADQFGRYNVVERAFTLREAAISAANCADWPQAEQWFLDATDAASKAHSEDMVAMAAGLRADAAAAALKKGDVERALGGFAEAIDRLGKVDADASLRGAYCHRVVRHTILWAQSQIERKDVIIGGEPILMRPGACSNPDPLPAIKELPLGHIDIAWYMLAEAEIVAGADCGIAAQLDSRLVAGPIPSLEFGLRMEATRSDVEQLAADRFSVDLVPYVEGGMFVSVNKDRLQGSFNPVSPERGTIPELDLTSPFPTLAESTATEAILAFCVYSALTNHREAVESLEAALDAEFGGVFPGAAVFSGLKGNAGVLAEQEALVVRALQILRQGDHIEPYQQWGIGLRLFEWADRSNFKSILTPRFAAWLRTDWRRIVTTETFRLRQPRQTVPAIEVVLAEPGDCRSFIAKLLLASYPAVGAQLDASFVAWLEHIADDAALVEPSHNPI